MRQRIRQCRAAPTTGVGWARAILFCLRKRLIPAYDLSKWPGKPSTPPPYLPACGEGTLDLSPAGGEGRVGSMPAMQFRRELGGYPLMDDRSGGVIAKPALL